MKIGVERIEPNIYRYKLKAQIELLKIWKSSGAGGNMVGLGADISIEENEERK